MNSETAYQNRDLSNPNPLAPEPNSNVQTDKSVKKIILPQDPKIKLLIILASVVFILLIISILVTTIKKSNPPLIYKTEPTPINTPAPNGPDDTGYSNIPDSYKTKFNIIDKKNQTDINFNPPQITDDIGR